MDSLAIDNNDTY